MGSVHPAVIGCDDIRRGVIKDQKAWRRLADNQWRNVQLGVNAQTLEIRANKVNDTLISNAPMLPQLLAQIPEKELLRSVSADGARDTNAFHENIAHRQAITLIPMCRGVKPCAESQTGARARNEILRSTQELGRSIWKKWSGYHRRSLVETKMGCFKRLGERIMVRHTQCQVTELQVQRLNPQLLYSTAHT